MIIFMLCLQEVEEALDLSGIARMYRVEGTIASHVNGLTRAMDWLKTVLERNPVPPKQVSARWSAIQSQRKLAMLQADSAICNQMSKSDEKERTKQLETQVAVSLPPQLHTRRSDQADKLSDLMGWQISRISLDETSSCLNNHDSYKNDRTFYV